MQKSFKKFLKQWNKDKFINESRQFFHLVDRSPWPLIAAFNAFFLVMGGTVYMHSYKYGLILLLLGLFLLFFTSYGWWRDIVREGTFLGFHTELIQIQLKIGIILFICTEALLFFSFFWAFFHSSLSPTLELGSIWPPEGIKILKVSRVPLLNTLLLLWSGIFITIAHHLLLKNIDQTSNQPLRITNWNIFLNKIKSIKFLPQIQIIKFYIDPFKYILSITRFLNKNLSNINFFKRFQLFKFFFEPKIDLLNHDKKLFNKIFYFNYITITTICTLVLAFIFLFFQYLEYRNACFGISDSVYGSSFFVATGFHGLHVTIGAIFILICLIRLLNYHFKSNHHIGFEAAIWYWHFVDVVWLFLFVTIYWWGSL